MDLDGKKIKPVLRQKNEFGIRDEPKFLYNLSIWTVGSPVQRKKEKKSNLLLRYMSKASDWYIDEGKKPTVTEKKELEYR